MRNLTRFFLVASCVLVPIVACSSTPTSQVNTPVSTASASSSVALAPTIDHAVTFVMDRSGSMTGTKLEETKKGILAAISELTASDAAAVIAFDSQATPVVSMQRATDSGVFTTGLGKLAAGGGTDYMVALKAAFQGDARAFAKHHHVIFLSDGMAPMAGVLAAIDDAAAKGVTLSTVGIGADAGNDLSAMADHGHGRYYAVKDMAMIGDVLTKEVTLIMASKPVDP